MRNGFLDADGRTHSIPALAARYAIMVSLLFVFVGPFLWMILLAIREGNIYDFQLIPDKPTLANFAQAWNEANIGRAFLNSVLVSGVIVASNVLLCSMAAYPLARMDFPGKRVIFLLILSTLMIPFHLFMIPLYLLCRNLHLLDSFAGIILPSAAGAFGIYLLRQYYQTIPRDLEEAARIDGAGEFRLWWTIMVPLTKPALAALAIFVFVQSWSNFLWPLIVIQSEHNYTLPIAVAKLAGAFVGKTQTLAAGSVLAVAPVIVAFFFLQRYFIGGLTLGSVKG